MSTRRCKSTITEYNHCVERGTPLEVYYNFMDVNGENYYLGDIQFSLMLKPSKRSSEVMYLWNTSESVERESGIWKYDPLDAGIFYWKLSPDFTSDVNDDEIYYNIEVSSGSNFEDEILEGRIKFIKEQQI